MQDQLWDQHHMVQPLEEGDPRSEESEKFTVPLAVKIQQCPLTSNDPGVHAALSALGMELLDKDVRFPVRAGTVARVVSAEEPWETIPRRPIVGVLSTSGMASRVLCNPPTIRTGLG